MIERENSMVVEQCLAMEGSEAVRVEAIRRAAGERLLFAHYGMAADPDGSHAAANINQWHERISEREPKWLGRLAIGSACIVLETQSSENQRDITVGVGIWLAPEP